MLLFVVDRERGCGEERSESRWGGRNSEEEEIGCPERECGREK